MEFNDGNQWHYVTNPGHYPHEMYEMRTCSARAGRMYIDPQFAPQRAMLQPRLKAYLHYQFPYQNAGTPEHQANYFCDALGELRSNEMVMLDTEDRSGLNDPADFMRRWCSVVEARLGTLAWIYVPRGLASRLTRAVTGPRIRKCPRYSGHAGHGKAPDWDWDVWQYTDRGPFPGSPHGPGDCNVTAMSADQLLARCKGAVGQVRPPTIGPGSTGPWVRRLQELLNAHAGGT